MGRLRLWLTPFLFLCSSGLLFPPYSSAIGQAAAKQRLSPKAGLGDLFTDIDDQWAQGKREETKTKDGSRRVNISLSGSCLLSFDDSAWGGFGSPRRSARLEGGGRGCFGSGPSSFPASSQFFDGIRALLPRDTKLQKAYGRDVTVVMGQRIPDKKEVYIFSSRALSKLPDIGTVAAYGRWKHPLGTFTLFVTYDLDRPDQVRSWLMALGQPSDIDIEHMVEIRAGWFPVNPDKGE